MNGAKRMTLVLLMLALLLPWAQAACAQEAEPASYAEYILQHEQQPLGQSLYVSEGMTLEPGDSVTLEITAEQTGLYYPVLTYAMTGDNILSSAYSLQLDGQSPYQEAAMLTLDTLWTQDDEFDLDRYGNEVLSMPEKYREKITCGLRDKMGYYSDGLGLYLTAGAHTLTLTCHEGAFTLYEIAAKAAGTVPEKTDGQLQGDACITLEAELVDYRSSPNIRPASNQSIDLTPMAGTNHAINHIEEASYDQVGDLLVYEFEAEEEGWYGLALHAMPSTLANFPVYRTILIDGELPSEAFRNARFEYSSAYRYASVRNDDGSPALVYLTKGPHTVSLRSSVDPLRTQLTEMTRITEEISALALEITKMAGGNTDKYRDFNLDSYGFHVRDDLNKWIGELEGILAELVALSGKDEVPGALTNLQVVINTLKQLEKRPNDLPKKLGMFSQGTSSANAMLIETITNLSTSPMGLNSLCFYMDESVLPEAASMSQRVSSAAEQFVASFRQQSYEAGGDSEGKLQVWVNRSRQMLEILQRMADTEFTPKTGIEVEFSIMPDESKLVLANASGKAPDVALSVSSGRVYELAVRGALTDLRGFDTFKEVASRVPAGLLIPGACNEGMYAIPETFSFTVLFYRKDILASLGLEVPNTHEEVLGMLPVLHRYGMNYNNFAANSIGYKGFGVTTPYIFQAGGKLYEPGNIRTLLGSQESLEGLQTLTDSFIYYDMDFEVASFYQAFRDGTLPIGTGDLFTFNLLLNAAPELSGKWGIALYPGVEDENGQVQRYISGAAQSDMIFASSDMKEEAWQFLDWWMSDEIQKEFAYTLQATLGNEYIWTSANVNAFAAAPIQTEHRDVIVEQMQWIYETPRVPGSYMVEREISNAIYAVINDGDNLRQALDKAVTRIDKEVERKLEEFGWLENGELVVNFSVPDLEEIKGWLK